MSKQPTLDSRIIFTMIKVGTMLPNSVTLHTLLRVFTWSLTALSNGVFPDRDFESNLFTEENDPYRARMAGQPLTCDGRLAA